MSLMFVQLINHNTVNVVVSLVTKGVLIAAALTVGLPLWAAVLGDVGVSLLVTINGLRLLHAPEPAS